jgi:hypothetical protein
MDKQFPPCVLVFTYKCRQCFAMTRHWFLILWSLSFNPKLCDIYGGQYDSGGGGGYAVV